MLYIYLLFVIYSSLAGSVEAILYGKKGAETFSWNEHAIYVFARTMVLFSILFAGRLVPLSNIDCFIYAIICTLSFSFFHNGVYFETARRINRPDYRFWSNSKTSTAKIEMTWAIRLSMLFVSVGLLILYYTIV